MGVFCIKATPVFIIAKKLEPLKLALKQLLGRKSVFREQTQLPTNVVSAMKVYIQPELRIWNDF